MQLECLTQTQYDFTQSNFISLLLWHWCYNHCIEAFTLSFYKFLVMKAVLNLLRKSLWSLIRALSSVCEKSMRHAFRQESCDIKIVIVKRYKAQTDIKQMIHVPKHQGFILIFNFNSNVTKTVSTFNKWDSKNSAKTT